MAAQTFQQEYMQMPPITRAYTTACVLTTLKVQLDLVSPFQIYFNPELIFRQYQLWRLVTSFLYFGPIGFNLLFNMIFAYRYCRMLEEGSFRGRTADFFFFLCFCLAPFLPWVLLGFSLLLGNSVIINLMGIAIGHVYFFLEDVFPQKQGRFKVLKTPAFLKYLLDPPADQDDYNPLPEDNNGLNRGFRHGQDQGEQQDQ
ncbi:unnamed protein product [Candidula unifasciata]|uniref:Derlin n=1 Tax=Candidula unifasciata TaxID=100452 RepID=A0A8S3ZNJ2_9EUPU|nr:unnamed protein product [Candidula unifasciata]